MVTFSAEPEAGALAWITARRCAGAVPARPTDKQTSVESEMSAVNLLERLRSSGNADTCSPNTSERARFLFARCSRRRRPREMFSVGFPAAQSRDGKDARQVIPSVKAKKRSSIVRGQGSTTDEGRFVSSPENLLFPTDTAGLLVFV